MRFISGNMILLLVPALLQQMPLELLAGSKFLVFEVGSLELVLVHSVFGLFTIPSANLLSSFCS